MLQLQDSRIPHGLIAHQITRKMARRKLEFLVLHCTATPEGRDFTSQDVRRSHLAPVSQGGRGWSVPGYHRLIRLNGAVEVLVSFNSDGWVDPREVTNGAKGVNDRAIHIAYAGGMTSDMKAPKDTRTTAQLTTMERVVKDIIALFPDIKVAGHNQFANKACPSFNTVTWLRSIGVADKNIFIK